MLLKGICQGYFRKGTSLETMFSRSQAAGFDAVELAYNRPDGIGLTADTTVADARDIRELAAQYGIQLKSVMFAGRMFASRNEEERQQGNASLSKQLELASILGADTVLVVPGVVDEQMAYDEVYERSQETLAKVLPAAEAFGVSIAIENVGNNFLQSPLEFARYIDEFRSPYMGAYFDVGNVLRIGFPDQWIRILGQRIRKIHLKDRLAGTMNGGFVPLLSGAVDWLEVRKALHSIGYDDVLTAEMSPYGSFPNQALYDIARHIGIIITGESEERT